MAHGRSSQAAGGAGGRACDVAGGRSGGPVSRRKGRIGPTAKDGRWRRCGRRRWIRRKCDGLLRRRTDERPRRRAAGVPSAILSRPRTSHHPCGRPTRHEGTDGNGAANDRRVLVPAGRMRVRPCRRLGRAGSHGGRRRALGSVPTGPTRVRGVGRDVFDPCAVVPPRVCAREAKGHGHVGEGASPARMVPRGTSRRFGGLRKERRRGDVRPERQRLALAGRGGAIRGRRRGSRAWRGPVALAARWMGRDRWRTWIRSIGGTMS
eukprot:scaffold867_cov317-Pavlova_lutheri.AAC.1